MTNSFRAVVISLWLKLITVAVVALLFAITMLLLGGRMHYWSLYTTVPEIIFEFAVRWAFAMLLAVALGTAAVAVTLPFMLAGTMQSREGIARSSVRVAVGLAVFVDFGVLVRFMLRWFHVEGTAAIIMAVGYCCAFIAALIFPRMREQILSSLDGFLGARAIRRTALAILIVLATVIAGERVLARGDTASAVSPHAADGRKTNIILITFDALAAEDMSLYGYHLPTTPHISDFAGKSSVFTNFYSASTFTTPSVAAILTGLYPSEHHIYQLEGRLGSGNRERTLPHLLRESGYDTAASISSPYVYFLAEDLASEFDILPAPPYRTGALMDLWTGVGFLHQRGHYGSRLDEFRDLEDSWDVVPAGLEALSPGKFARTRSGFPPDGSFRQALSIVNRLPEGFFLWVHVMAPHGPYLPDAQHAGRYLPSNDMRTETEQTSFGQNADSRYQPGEQHLVDQARLRYDEFVANADDAFGAFMGELEKTGRLRNTAVIVSADHGESFEGGIYSHASKYQTRPEIHIPLIIRLPGQEQGRQFMHTADETALAPTVLEIAGVNRPEWMKGKSLFGLLNGDGEDPNPGLAFTQYFAASSVFKPLRAGTVGVIGGRYQYVMDLSNGKGILRRLTDASSWNRDESAETPALAEAMRKAIYSRFPGLQRESK